MSIAASGISYRHTDCPFLFKNIDLFVPDGAKVSLIGPNGIGKSTLLKIIAGRLAPFSGNVSVSSHPYYIPQQPGSGAISAAELLGAADRLNALRAICAGSVDPENFDTLGNDWDIGERCRAALDEWGLHNVTPDTPAGSLSGGERTRVMLAGLTLANPEIVLLDEPTNHLDSAAREKLYGWVRSTGAALLVVSHDITLLRMMEQTCELTASGIRLYGGGYDFYRERRDIEDNALESRIEAGQAALRKAVRQAREVRERQERRAAQGERDKASSGQARILINARGAQAQNSASRLMGRHAAIIGDARQKLSELRGQMDRRAAMKLDFDSSALHAGKRLIKAEAINFSYPGCPPLWREPFDVEIRSGDRVRISGGNGSGKTTLLKILTGEIKPDTGTVERAGFSSVCIDQDYRELDSPLSVLEMAQKHNVHNLAEHEIRIRLDRALFPPETWGKPCSALSGGERMRLMLCCMMISEQVPEMFILDEPTNNLDIASMEILLDTVNSYRGTLVLVSHDGHFAGGTGITSEIDLDQLRRF